LPGLVEGFLLGLAAARLQDLRGSP
jgi:hypothetical protein